MIKFVELFKACANKTKSIMETMIQDGSCNCNISKVKMKEN